MSKSKAFLSLLLTATLWSTGGVLIKLVDLNPFVIAGVRSAIAALIISLWVRKSDLKVDFNRMITSLFFAGTVTLFVLANKLTTAANAILLQYTAPIYVALLSPLLLKEEKTNKKDWIGVFTAMTGLILFFIDELSPANLLGNCIAVGSGVSFALYNIFMRKQKDESPVVSTFLGNVLTFFVNLPFLFVSAWNVSMRDTAALLALGVFQLGIPYVLYSKSIKYVRAIEAVLITTLEPVLNPLWVFLVFGEKPGKWAFVGGTLVVLSSVLRGSEFFKKFRDVKL